MEFKEKPFVSIVVYLYNSSKEIEAFLKNISNIISSKFENYEYIFVDDFSQDGTYEKLIEVTKTMKIKVSIIRLARKHNKELALLAGADKSVGDYIFEFETPIIDYPTELINEMYNRTKKGYDVVTLEPTKRAFFTKVFYFLFNKFSYIDYNVYTERIILYSRRAMNSILNINEKIRNRKALLFLTGFMKTNIRFSSINNNYRDTRKFFEKIQMAVEILVSYSSIGTKLPIFLSIIFILFSICASLFAVYIRYFKAGIVSGWASMIIFLSISFAGLFFILGILSEYISKILKESINIPLYTIQKMYSGNDI